MRRCFRGAIALLVILAGSDLHAEDRVIPGLEMDALSKQTVEAWRKKVARTPTQFAESPVVVKHPAYATRPPVVEGTYRFDIATGKLTWSDAGRGRMMEQGWWRQQLDWLLREPGLLFYLAHSKLTGQASPQGVRVQVTGRSPMRILQFDSRGHLEALTVTMARPGGGTQEAELALTHTQRGDSLLLTKYLSDTPAPGGGRAKEMGRIDWKLVHGKPLPSAIRLDLEQGPQKLALVVNLGPWRLEKEAMARTDAAAGRVLQFWENREYNLGRRGIETARCDLEFDDGGRVVRGRYHWDGKAGKETWDESAIAERLGSTWRKTLDDVFRRYPLREDIGVRDLTGDKKDGQTVVRIESLFPSEAPRGHQSLSFDAKSTLQRVELVRPDGTAGVLTPTWRRFDYPREHIFAGMLQYMAPTRWAATWTRPDGSTYRTTKSVTYALTRRTHLPSRLEITFAGEGVRARSLVFRFRNWRLTKFASLPR